MGLLNTLFPLSLFFVLPFVIVLLLVSLGRGFHAWRQGSRTRGEESFLLTVQSLIQGLKQSERELKERADSMENYNENILHSVTSGVILVDHARVITMMNEAARRILGVERGMIEGISLSEVFGPESEICRVVEGAIQSETPLFRQECLWQRGDGEKVWMGLSLSFIRDRRGEMMGSALVFTDLTEIKRLQEQVELKKRLAILGEVSVWIAHEFRNFMAGILGFARLLAKKTEKGDPRQESIEAIMTELRKMDQLIQDLLAFCKSTEIYPVEVSLATVIQEAVDQVFSQIEGRRPKAICSLAPNLPLLRIDPVLMRQVLSNLVQNAVEAIGSGDGEILISAALRSRSQECEVRVANTGPPIPKENLEKIFLPFFTTKERGTGLGLALVQKIVLAHNGRIEVESGTGIGTTFTLFLPLGKAEKR